MCSHATLRQSPLFFFFAKDALPIGIFLAFCIGKRAPVRCVLTLLPPKAVCMRPLSIAHDLHSNVETSASTSHAGTNHSKIADKSWTDKLLLLCAVSKY